MLAVFRTAPTAQHYDHDRNSRAHNSAYSRVLSGVWYYPVIHGVHIEPAHEVKKRSISQPVRILLSYDESVFSYTALLNFGIGTGVGNGALNLGVYP
ncbi:hypothetical protein EAG_01071 [Camponotus floridanus]|uniref:Uncharacterized protein n=1 Tax=Camponotus floridanus TaxID=104421 RepID=E2AB55_CAMFO|nr:hypothetical protein EAG_01071 [Camponotus floridanus]